jgi:hypothetical protein
MPCVYGILRKCAQVQIQDSLKFLYVTNSNEWSSHTFAHIRDLECFIQLSSTCNYISLLLHKIGTLL